LSAATESLTWFDAGQCPQASSMLVESRFGADGVRDLDLFIATAHILLVPVDVEQGHLARQAFRHFRAASRQSESR
jgi:uncharacterized protein with PIN domain